MAARTGPSIAFQSLKESSSGGVPGRAVPSSIAQAGVGVGRGYDQVADRPVELAGGPDLVGDTDGLQPAERLLGEVRVIEND